VNHPIADLEAAIVATLLANQGRFDSLPPTLRGGHFMDRALGRIFDLGKVTHEAGAPFRANLVATQLTADDADVLTSMVPHGFLPRLEFEAAASRVLAAAVLRDLAAGLDGLAQSALAVGAGPEEILRQAGDLQLKAEATLAGAQSADGWMDEVDGMTRVIEEAEAASRGEMRGVMTGLPSLDKITGGFRPTRTWVIGARTSEGKSTFAGQLALRAAEHGAGVLYVSLEMPADQIWQRLASSATGINSERFRDGDLSPADIAALTSAASAMNSRLKGRLQITSRCSSELSALLAELRFKVRQTKPKVVIVDYLQKIVIGRGVSRGTNRNNDVETASTALANLAREMQICMVSVSQFNRSTQGDRPSLVNLRDSGAIEQDADVVALLWSDQPEDIYRRILSVEKNRDGRRGDIVTSMDPDRMTFRELTAVTPCR